MYHFLSSLTFSFHFQFQIEDVYSYELNSQLLEKTDNVNYFSKTLNIFSSFINYFPSQYIYHFKKIFIVIFVFLYVATYVP